MNFDALDAEMRVYETSRDYLIPPDVYIVIRLDGRNFTKLTKEKHSFEMPFDLRVSNWMTDTVVHLMNCGPRFRYGYTQSDEISLLLHKQDNTFNRKSRKLISILAGEASAKFSLLLGDLGCFDARICELPSAERVVDYFRWRQEDAGRNALSAHCYWLLRRKGRSPATASTFMAGQSVSEKHELLRQNGIDFASLPTWQRLGVGVFWNTYEKSGADPRTGQQVNALRSRLETALSLPGHDEYAAMIHDLLDRNPAP